MSAMAPEDHGQPTLPGVRALSLAAMPGVRPRTWLETTCAGRSGSSAVAAEAVDGRFDTLRLGALGEILDDDVRDPLDFHLLAGDRRVQRAFRLLVEAGACRALPDHDLSNCRA